MNIDGSMYVVGCTSGLATGVGKCYGFYSCNTGWATLVASTGSVILVASTGSVIEVLITYFGYTHVFIAAFHAFLALICFLIYDA